MSSIPEDTPLGRYVRLLREEPELFRSDGHDDIRIVTDLDELLGVESAQRARLTAQSRPSDWGTVGVVFDDQYIQVLRDAVEFPDGRSGTYIRILTRRRGVNGVAILPIFGDRIVLIRHFRHATRSWHWEIPRGFVDDGETLEQAARRELWEETGYSSDQLEQLGNVHPNTGLIDERVTVFRATFNPQKVASRRALAEGIDSIRLVTRAELNSMIGEGLLTDAFTLAALTMAQAGSL